MTDLTVNELAVVLAKKYHPHGIPTYDKRGLTNEPSLWRPVDGSESTMVVERASDGHNSIRALSCREVAEVIHEHMTAKRLVDSETKKSKLLTLGLTEILKVVENLKKDTIDSTDCADTLNVIVKIIETTMESTGLKDSFDHLSG